MVNPALVAGEDDNIILLQHIALAFELPFAICSGGSWYVCTNTNFV